MSGHSHWSTVKRKKGSADARRGQVFSKLAKIIAITAREGGPDPETNPKLRLAINQAKSFNMPSDNVERAIKRGLGELEGQVLERIEYEAYGPGAIPIIIEVVTDNKNRALSELKHILSLHGGKLASEGSVKWGFQQKGVLEIKPSPEQKKEELELKIIDAGAEDFKWHNETLEVYTSLQNLQKINDALENQGIKIESTSLDWVPREEVKLKDEKVKNELNKLFEALDEHDDVEEIYSNIKNG